MPRITTPKYTYTMDYPEALAASDTQMSIFWTADEINVEKDIQDIKVNMTESESHGVITTLKLFTLYELSAGRDYWLNRVMKRFPRPDIQRAASTFGFFELNVHGPFYNKINEALLIDTDEFYSSYVDDPVLKARMDFVERIVSDKDDLYSLAAFSFVEGAVLYSSFAFLKHFQAKGKNKLMNVVRGINFSVRDENLHAEFGAWLFNQLKSELDEEQALTQVDHKTLADRIYECAAQVYEHECRIIDMIFERGEMDGITAEQMKAFVKSRVNLCLGNLGYGNLYEVKNNVIADWFYDNINSVQFGDFFTGTLSNYNRDWDESRFEW